MKNDLTWLDELPDFGAESSENVVNETAVAEAKPLPVAVAQGVPVAQREGDLKAFLLAGVTDDAEAHARLKQNAELEGLNARRGMMDALNSRAVAGQTIMRYAYPELGQEPGAYFQKVGKVMPESQTRTDAYAAVYDDYMAGVEAEYNALIERRKAWDRNKAVVSQAASDMVAGRVSVPELLRRLDVEQQKVYEQEFDAAAMEKAGVAMSLVREAFSESAEAGLKKMVDQGLANQVTAALSDADEAGGLVVNEKAAGMFQAALMSLMKEARQASGEEYKFLHNMTMALGNPVRRRKKDIQGVLGMMVQADTAAALAMAGEDKESRKVTAEIEKNIEELRERWQNDTVYARLRGMLDAAQSAGNETAETADFWAKTVNALGSVIGQTAPFFVPGMGTGLAFAMAYDEKRNAAYFKGLKEGTAEWSAFIDAATSVAVEKIAFGGWNRFSATARVMEKIPGYGAVRNTLLGSFYARAALEVGAGVFEESVLEPTAEALLQWGLRNGVFRWHDVGGKYDWAEYAAELKQMFKPEQLMATVIFGAGLTGMQSPLIKEAAKGYSRHVEYLMAQGIGEEEARNIAAMDDADARVEAAVRARAEAWKDPAAAELHRRIAATRFAEIEEARALWESKAYAEMKKELRLPDVERLEGKSGQYSITTYDYTTGDVLFRGEVGEEQLLAMLGHYIREEDRLRVHRAQSVMGANALLRAVERTGEIVVEDLGEARNPESGEQVISDFGMMGEAEFKYAAALALDEYEARRERGMSEEEALATPFAALSKYMPLRGWMALEEAFKERLETARQTSGEQDAVGTRLFQTVPAEGASKADTLFMASRGQVEAREVLEDTLEHGQKKVTGNDPAKIRAWHGLLRDAQKAMKQLGFKVDFYTGHDDMDAAALQGRITEGMSKLASSYVLTQADALPLPGWVKDLFRWHTAQLEDAAALVALGNAYKLGRERGNISQDIEDILRELGHKAASMYQTAELTEVDVQAYKEARMRYMDVTGDVTPTAAEVRAEQAAADAEERERVRAADDVKSVLPPREDGLLDERTISPVGDLPEEVRGAFPKGACYNLGARAWLGMVPVARLHLSPDAPQVKVGGNKKGVVNPLVGDYRQDAPPLYVWQRRNGSLEVISGRHRLDLAKRTGTEFVAAYVYVEDEAHDAKWARLLDYEQNMQDDQADELTAAIYVRETQLSDEELTRRGLTRGGTKSARGILIGREAREDLWSRFQSKAIDARTAEAICRLTMYMPDKSRIDAMQAMAAADLAKGKSLDHVAAKLQLMAHADADGEATQGLLSFGESFDEALERSAEFIAKSIEVINKHIAAVTKARSLGKGGVSEQEGISVGLDMDPKQRLAELNELKAAYEKCGFHENIRFRALTWDGKSDVDPIGDYARDKAAAAEWAEPTEEELEQQARDEAAEATGTFGFSVANAQEMAQIKAAAEKDGTFMKAPNGQRSNLNERQWLQVRTAAFKRWFGDWERVSLFRAAYNRIMSMASVASLSGKEFGRGLTPEKMAEHWQTVCGGKVEHDALGVVVLTKRSAKDCLAHGLHREKIAVFAKVHDVIRNGVVFDRQSNWKQRGYDTCCLAAPVTISGKEYICQVVVKQFKDRNQFYLHEVELKEKLPTEGRTGFYFGSTSGGATGLITQKADEVNALWKNCSKIVDSNGEPMVMYHGSPTAGIREFRNHRALYGDGVFFTESPEEALEYTGLDRDDFEDYDEMDAAAVERGLLYECFLNIRDGERFYHGGGGTYHAMATAPTEIKSATANRGTFDGSSPDITFSVTRNLAAVSPEMDARYMEAVKRGDMDAAQRMVNDVARMRGYMPDSDYQGSECFNGAAPGANAYFDTDDERYEAWENGEFEGTVSLADFVRRGMDPGELEWLVTSPGAYQRADQYKRESIEAIRKAKASKSGKVTIYRAVPADIKEGSVRNGDWVTFSKAYVEYHISLQDWEKGRIIKQVVPIDDVWWDGNDVNEWGYDDGKEYAYRNTANNRKLLDAVTYDKNGDIVPLSKRFDYSSPDVSFSVVGENAANWDKIKHLAFRGRDDGKLRVEIDDSQARLKWEDLQGKKVSAYRRIISGWDSVPRDERRVIESFAELCWESDEASKLLNESDGENLAENRRNAMKLADEVKERRAEVRDVIGRLFRQMGADSSVAITAQDDMVDAMALDFWSEWPSAKVEDSLASDPMEFGMELSDVLDYPELYEAYPQLKDLRVYTDDLKGYNGIAGHNGWSDYITMNRSLLGDWEKFRSVLLHEVQHVIQRIEGFAKGGNKESVRRQVKDLLEGTETRMEFLERDLRWFSAVDIARDFLKEARMLRRYPNAWKRSGQRFRFARMSSTADEVREAILRDIAERYEKFRRDDTGETLLLEMEDSLLPEVHFSSLEGIEAGLAALDKIKSRKLAFRGTAARKSRRLADLQKRYNGIKRVLDEFEYEPYELYVRLAGEIESRNVQLRRDWTAEQRAAKPFNETLEYPGEALVAFSVTSMADAAKGLMSGGGMEITRAGELIKDFNAQIDNWNRVAAGKEGRADARTGAEMFGTVQALLSAARRVLPEGYRANVYTLMQWASVYAGMAETGQLPEAGALKGNAKILEAFRKRMLNETAMAADKAEAEAMLASIGEQKLNEVMVKVLQQVRGQLAKYAKDELWAKMMRVVERAYAKSEQGKKPKRGKMAAVDYKKLERLSELLRMEPDAVREEMDGLQGKLSGAKDAERVAEFEAELAELSTFGGWSGMSLQQAAAAYEAMVIFCATGRTSWKQSLDRRKAEIEFMAREMSKALPTDRTASATRLAEQNKLLKAMAKLPYGMMNYCQLMLAMSSRLGEGFCWERIQEMTEANAALLNAEKGRMAWMYKLVQGVSGRKGEVACEKWLAEFDTPEDTGIELSPMAWCEVEMTLEAAEKWLAAGKEEREKRWKEREKEEKRRRVSLRLTQPMVPEALIPELQKAVKEYRENPRRSSGKVTVRGEYVDKGRAKTLTCSRDGALYAILLHEQSDYQTVFDRGQVAEAGLLYREGLNTPAKIQALYDFVGPAGLRYGYELRKMLQKQGLTVAQVFEAREGVPFRFRDNYFRASFDRLAVQDKNPLTDSKVSGIGGGKYGMLVNRVAHHREAAKWDMGASMVFLAASMEQDNYIYTSHITDRWRKLLLQQDFASRLQAYVGDDVMKKLVAWMDVIDGAPLDNMSAFMNLSHWQGFFTGAWAASVLNGNGYVLIKQASALWHGYVAGYVPESIREQEDGIRELSYRHIGMAEFLHYAAAGGPVSLAELKESKYFTARRTAEGKGVAMQGRMNAGRQRSALAVPSEVMGDWIEKTDSILNLLSARALANAFYAAHKKLNEQHGNLLTDAELKAAAIDAVGRMLELGAQPLTRMQKSIFQNSSGMLGKMTFAMKSESINKFGLICAQWTHGEHVAPIVAWMTLGLMNAGIAYLISMLQGDDDEKDTWATHATSIGVSAVTGPLSAVPVLSEGIAELASMITGERVYSDSLARQIFDFGNMKRQVEKLYKHHSGEREMGWERYFKTITTLLRSSGAGFGAFSRSGSAALSSFGSLALSAAAGANLSRVAKDALCAVGLFDREKEGKKKKPKRE